MIFCDCALRALGMAMAGALGTRRASPYLAGAVAAVTVLAALCLASILQSRIFASDATVATSVALVAEKPASPPPSTLAFFLNLGGLFYTFIALYVACDEFFVPALDAISRKLGLAPDVAGATFMAAGGSAPEFFTSMVGALASEASDVGIAAIVGSAIFNVLFVIGCCGLASPTPLQLTGYPLTRDCIFYIGALGFLVCTFWDSMVKWHEALILLVIYICYVIFMANNKAIQDKIRTARMDEGDRDAYKKFVAMDKNQDGVLTRVEVARDRALAAKFDRLDTDKDGVLTFDEMKWELRSMRNYTRSTTESVEEGYQQQEGDDDEENEPINFCPPAGSSCKDLAWYLFTLPLIISMGLTVPDVRRKGFECLYVPGFVLSIVWIAFFSMKMVDFSEVVGEFTGLPISVLGLTLLAWGTSVPDLLTSVLVTWQGHGDMAVSSSIGSNIFDVTVGLPVPWLVFSATKKGAAYPINSKGMGINMTLLVMMVAFTCGSIMLNKWVLNKTLGCVMLFLWLLFQVYMIYNVFNS